VSTLRQGSIVYTVVLNSQGRDPKRRPVVLITPPEQVPAGEPLIGVAISTKPKDPLPAECVRIPSNRRRQGSSQLPERSAAVCNWAVKFYEKDIEDVGGMVYGELLFEIVSRVQPYVVQAQPPVSRPDPDPPTDAAS
jgi:hypothetical protein